MAPWHMRMYMYSACARDWHIDNGSMRVRYAAGRGAAAGVCHAHGGTAHTIEGIARETLAVRTLS